MIKVLIVDDSATVRMLLSQGLSLDPEIKVVGTAPDPFAARDKIATTTPDVITLDVEMPRMDGLEFLRRIMTYHPLPVVMVSALTEKGKRITLEALELGAVDYVTKPSGSHGAAGLNEMLVDLRRKIKIAAKTNLATLGRSVARPPAPGKPTAAVGTALAETTNKVIALGASTGGTNAIRAILSRLPADTPGIVIVQHITPGYSAAFAERLNNITALNVKEAASGDSIIPGRVLIAPGALHTRVVRSGGVYLTECSDGERVCGNKPSVDVLFESVAACVGGNALGIILTGMGTDGAKGLLAMRQAGARTIGQDEASSIVYGMPKAAWELGAVQKQVSQEDMAQTIIDLLESPWKS